MKTAIMQPYFLPYIGYFQLMAAVDVFIVYDNIQYTKKGWVNRNRMLLNGTDSVFTLALKKDSDFLDVRDRSLSDTFDRAKLLNKFYGAYRRAPYFSKVLPLIEEIVKCEHQSLFEYIYTSIEKIKNYMGLECEFRVSSTIDIDHALTAQDKVIALCKKVGATTYINPQGGVNLYDCSSFNSNDITLKFLRSRLVSYTQFTNEFVPWLSIIDVLMFNSGDEVKRIITTEYELF